ncbi:MAG: M48 family metalloprotease [Proteobacteria bacterium]|nr:M48 family metalloprotease [Pseudomonadota bacterium]
MKTRFGIAVGISTALAFLIVAACVQNPVTGERNLGLVSEAQELQLGQENYVPTQQMQGGEYTVDPELGRYVNSVGQKLAAAAKRDLPYEFVVINNDVPNAWALPGGKMAVNRGLLVELDSEAELAAVLGHEIVHADARHTAQTLERGMLLQLGVLAAGVAASDSEYGDLAVGAGMVGAQIINSKYGREAELEADRYGMQYMAEAGYNPEAAVSLQETFVRLSEGRNPNWLEGLFASHPPSQERVERNRAYLADLPDSGTLGRETYQQKTAHIRKVKPAYESYNEGVKALSEGNIALAEQKAREAIRVEPREGKFHGLLGQSAMHQEQNQAALQHFDKAIELNPQYFEHYVYRGALRQQAGNLAGARQDLEQSNQLLPTAIAHEMLGDIAAQQGRRNDAAQHYQVAAQSQSAVGQRAAEKLRRL